jgi:hypothetical protein
MWLKQKAICEVVLASISARTGHSSSLRLHWNKCIKGDLHMVKLGAVSTQCEL